MPQCLREKHGSFISLSDVWFHEDIAKTAIESAIHNDDYKTPLSFRLLSRIKKYHHKNGEIEKRKQFYVQVSLEIPAPEIITHRRLGAIGVDINADHLACGEIDRSGNPIHAKTYPFHQGRKNSRQLKAQFGDMVKCIVDEALYKGKPIVLENLDFKRKKSSLRETMGKKNRRMLSFLAYSQIHRLFRSRCRKLGVELIGCTPSFSSILGAYNYYGLSHKYTSHEMAAMILARRGCGFSDSHRSLYRNSKFEVHKAFSGAASIQSFKVPPPYSSFLEGDGKKHLWSYLRRYYKAYKFFVMDLQKDSNQVLNNRDSRRVRERLIPPPRGPSMKAAIASM